MNDVFSQHAIVHRHSVKCRREPGTGNGEPGTGNGESGTGNRTAKRRRGAIRAPTVRSGSRLPTVEFGIRAAHGTIQRRELGTGNRKQTRGMPRDGAAGGLGTGNCRSSPQGAAGCSHPGTAGVPWPDGGCSDAAFGVAQPVGTFVFQQIRPDGAEESPGTGVLSSAQKSPSPRRGEKGKKGPGPFSVIRFPPP